MSLLESRECVRNNFTIELHVSSLLKNIVYTFFLKLSSKMALMVVCDRWATIYCLHRLFDNSMAHPTPISLFVSTGITLHFREIVFTFLTIYRRSITSPFKSNFESLQSVGNSDIVSQFAFYFHKPKTDLEFQ